MVIFINLGNTRGGFKGKILGMSSFLIGQENAIKSWIKCSVLKEEILVESRDLDIKGMSLDENAQGKCTIKKARKKTLERS